MNGKLTPNCTLTRRQLLKYGLGGTLAAGLPGSLLMSGCSGQKCAQRPDIILITVDTLRADHLGCYGYPKNTSPNIDQFASESMLFENCLSHASNTRLSFASIFTGFLPHETRITENHELPLSRRVKTLAEILKHKGYKTAAVVSNYILRKGYGWEQGFEIYDDTMDDFEQVRNSAERTAEHTTNRAIELLGEPRKSPLFLWVHYQDPHGPYTPPKPFDGLFADPDQKPRYVPLNPSLTGRSGIPSYQKLGASRNLHHYVAQYDGEIRYHDEQFKRLIDKLKETGLYDKAMIMFSSDHGEGLGEHDYYFAHSEYLYSSLTHIPLIVRFGDQLSGRRADFVQHLDIVPTIYSVLGIKGDRHLRGGDLRQPQPANKEIFAEMVLPRGWGGIETQYSIVTDGHKLIYSPAGTRSELFDLGADPKEKNDLSDNPNYRRLKKDLIIRLNRIRSEDHLKLGSIKKTRNFTNEEIEKLRSLGYAQ